MIETSLLQTLVTVSQTLNLSQAAEKLGVTQSAISQNIKSIERRTGLNVIVRNGKTIAMSEEGRELAGLAKNFFFRFDDTLSRIQEERGKMVGELKIGTLNGLGKSWVASQIIRFAADFPEVNITVHMDFPENLQRRFERNELHAVVLHQDFVPAWAETRELLSEDLTLIAPKGMLPQDLTLKDLSNVPLVQYEQNDPNFYVWCRAKFGQVPRSTSPRIAINSFSHMLDAVNDGLGVCVIPSHVLARSPQYDNVETFGEESEVHYGRIVFAASSELMQTNKIMMMYNFLLEQV